MICQDLSSLLGFECTEISEDIARVDGPFAFDDGDVLPLYIQKRGNQVRFFDDGGVLLHFIGRGLSFEDGRRMRFIRTAAEPHEVTLTDGGDLEIWTSVDAAPSAFGKYLSTLVAITSWERNQRGVSTEVTSLIEEVGMCLRAWKPDAELTEDPLYSAVSGQVVKLDFKFDGEGVSVTTANANAVNATIHKLLDVRMSPENLGAQFLVVIDDRDDPDVAKRESLVIQAVGSVIPFTTLQAHANKTFVSKRIH